jgi:hypothetical protein
MIVQFNVRDFLDRAKAAYPERIGLVDEPQQPGEPWAPLTFAGMANGPGPRPPVWTAWA